MPTGTSTRTPTATATPTPTETPNPLTNCDGHSHADGDFQPARQLRRPLLPRRKHQPSHQLRRPLPRRRRLQPARQLRRPLPRRRRHQPSRQHRRLLPRRRKHQPPRQRRRPLSRRRPVPPCRSCSRGTTNPPFPLRRVLPIIEVWQKDPQLGLDLALAPWIQDGLGPLESSSVYGLSQLYDWDPALARLLLADSAVEPLNTSNVHTLYVLGDLAWHRPGKHETPAVRAVVRRRHLGGRAGVHHRPRKGGK